MRIFEFIFITGCTCAIDSIIIFLSNAFLTHSLKGYKRPLLTLAIIIPILSASTLINELCNTTVRYDMLLSFLPFTVIFTLLIALGLALIGSLHTKEIT